MLMDIIIRNRVFEWDILGPVETWSFWLFLDNVLEGMFLVLVGYPLTWIIVFQRVISISDIKIHDASINNLNFNQENRQRPQIRAEKS